MSFAQQVSNSLRHEFSIESTPEENYEKENNLVLSLGNNHYLQIMNYKNKKSLSLAINYKNLQYILAFHSVKLIEFDRDNKLCEILFENKIKYTLSDDETHIKASLSDIENIKEPSYIRGEEVLWHLVLDERLDFTPELIITALKNINYLSLLNLSETEKESLIKRRRGQGKFRKQLIDHWLGSCAVTGFDDESLLVASHIKPWYDSNNSERLDPYNGFLLSPNLDKAFDRGLITFTHKGDIVISGKFKNHEILGIQNNMNIKIEEEHKKYLEYHSQLVYKK